MAAFCALVTGTPFDASFASAASTGEPGMRRGRMKFSVIAAHSVMKNRMNLRSR